MKKLAKKAGMSFMPAHIELNELEVYPLASAVIARVIAAEAAKIDKIAVVACMNYPPVRIGFGIKRPQ
ncbi:MAG: hypothetical protein EBS82_06915 [Methylocystaceae bacterium]|nr:hypothetical protein [Methylocystaceae bacterium]